VVINATLVGPSEDTEGSLLTPRVVPRVGANPIGGAVINSPTNHLDSMATEVLAGDVLVDARGVGLKVFIDRERHRHGSVLHDLLLDVLDTLDRVRIDGLQLVLRVRGSVA
jgi:hypothetical protein